MSSILPTNNLVPLLVSGVALVSAVAAYQVGKTSGKEEKDQPNTVSPVVKQTDDVALVNAWFAKFEAGLKAGNINEVLALFVEDCYWRDLLSFTWNICTSEGKEQVRKMLQSCLGNTKPTNWRLTGTPTRDAQFNTIEAWFTFETAVARAEGHIRLRDGRCWTLLTTMQELKGHEEKKCRTRPRGTEHGIHRDRKSWLALKEDEERTLGYEKQPYVVIIGGGQGGIGLGARLKQLGVPTIIVDKHKRAGDQWRSRYKSLCLHDPIWYDHLPYMPFPEHWPVFCPKDKIGDWLEMYTKIMELNYWSSTECLKASYDEDAKEWSVIVDREGETVVLRPKHVVFSLGVSGFPNIPKIRGAEDFKGDQHHSSAHSGGDFYKGKKVAVIGGNNSAHDICADLWEHGVDVTMIQRTTTHIIRSETMMDIVFKPLYSEDAVEQGVSTHKADLIFASMPFKIMHEFQIPLYNEVKERDKEFYDRLRKRGFLLDFGDDESGLFLKYLRRGSGYYIDVGASELIANGSIKLKSGVQISHIAPHAVVMADGTEIPADVIVYATGYNSMTEWVSKLVSQAVADKVGKCWGLGSNTTKDPGPWEGELRNMWKPTQQENLWFHGGNLHQSRHYSKYVAMQLKARLEGIKTPVYGMNQVHHLR